MDFLLNYADFLKEVEFFKYWWCCHCCGSFIIHL